MTDIDTPVIVDALRAVAEQRSRVARRGARPLLETRDPRSGSVRLVRELAAADHLATVADQLAAGTLVITTRPVDEDTHDNSEGPEDVHPGLAEDDGE